MSKSPVSYPISTEIIKQSLNTHLYDFLNNSVSNELANIFFQEAQQNNHNTNSIPIRTSLLDQWEIFWQIMHINNYNNQLNTNGSRNNMMNNSNKQQNFGPHNFFLPKESQLDLLPLMATSTASNQTIPTLNHPQNILGNLNTVASDKNDTSNSSEVSSIFATRSESNLDSISVNSLKHNNSNKKNKKSPSNLSVSLQNNKNDPKNNPNNSSKTNTSTYNNSSDNINSNTIQFENVLFADAMASNFEGTISSHHNVSITPRITKKVSKSSSKSSTSKKSSRSTSSYTGTFQTTGWVQQFPENGSKKPSKKRSLKKNTPLSLASHSRKLEFFGGKNYSQRSNSISSSNCSSTTTTSSSSKLRIKNKSNNKSPAISNSQKLNTSSQVGTPLDTTATIEQDNRNFNTYPATRFIQTNAHNSQIYNGNPPGYNPAIGQHSYIENLLVDKLQFDENPLANVTLDQFEVMHSANSELDLTSINHRNSDSSKISSE